jgi:hypothetical protein
MVGVTTERAKVAKMPKSQRTAMNALEAAIRDKGEIPPADENIPANTKCVTLPVWREHCYRMGISTGEERARRDAFQRASTELIAKDGQVGVWDPWVWLK